MNFTIVENPYKDENSVITTRGVLTDAKIAKLNNDKKKPAIVKHWEENIPQPVVTVMNTIEKDEKKICTDTLARVGVTAVNEPHEVIIEGYKKIKTNQIVPQNTIKVSNVVDKIDVVPLKAPVVETPKEEIKEVPKVVNSLEPSIVSSREEVRGRHEHTGEIPVDAAREAVRNDAPLMNTTPIISRSERNIDTVKRVEQTTIKAGDMDEYNKLLHGAEDEDISRQLQGARDQLFKEEEKNKRVSAQLIAAEKELESLRAQKEQMVRKHEQKTKEEIEKINNSRGLLQEDTLEKTNNLTSIQSEIARLKAQMQAIEESSYEETRSYGRVA